MDLKPYGLNAKSHPVDQVERLAAHIQAAGWDQPIVVDRDGVIIKGHARREAALVLGLPVVPVVVRDDLDPLAVRLARLADNRVAESSWDRGTLARELEELSALDVDLSMAGFTDFELAELDRELRAAMPDFLDTPPRPEARETVAHMDPRPASKPARLGFLVTAEQKAAVEAALEDAKLLFGESTLAGALVALCRHFAVQGS